MLTFSFQVNHTHTKGLMTTKHLNFILLILLMAFNILFAPYTFHKQAALLQK